MKALRALVPPALYRVLRQHRFRRYGWFGDYRSWEEAGQASGGYDQAAILEKVKNAALKVKRGEAVFERDSVLFDSMEVDWPVLASLSWVAAQHDGELNVLDFGGSLGSTFYQHRSFLSELKSVRWNVIEQGHFVTTGRELFQDERLSFYYSVEECLESNNVNLVLLSSVLPYIQDPYGLLKRFEGFPFVVIDKMPLIAADRDRITIQRVPPEIYPATYPAWFFSEKKFLEYLAGNFEIAGSFERDVGANIASVFKGFLLTRKTRQRQK